MRYSVADRKPAVAVVTSLLAMVTIVILGFVPAVSDQAGPVLRYLGITSCSKTSACTQYTNSGTGAGAQGTSLKGSGLVGVTQFNSTSASNGTSGISGKDSSTLGTFDSGISGVSVRGTGVSASSTSGNAFVASSIGGSGLIARSTNSDAIYATSTNFYGIGGLTLNNSTAAGTGYAGVLAQDNSSDGGHLNSGVLGYSVNGIGVAAFSSGFVGANIIGGNMTGDFPALSLVDNAGTEFISACPPSAADPCGNTNFSVLDVDSLGDVYSAALIYGIVNVTGGCLAAEATCTSGNANISGQYQMNGHCLKGCAPASRTQPGRSVVSYVPTQSLPSIDDFGEASLENGYAYVQLDAAFRNVVDRNASYLVFITPEGDSRGLYVTQKTAQGFMVRENMGGHSSLAFSYRIVAKPLGKQEARLPMVTIPKLRTPSNIHQRTIPPKDR